MNTLDDLMLAYHVARLYYLENLTQSDIAKQINISRPQVSRLIKKARESGIVTIQVEPPFAANSNYLAKALKEALSLRTVILAPTEEMGKEKDNALYIAAAEYLSETLKDLKAVGIGWGKTIYHTALHLKYEEKASLTKFYPVAGNSGSQNPYFQVNTITNRFAEKFKSDAWYINTMALTANDQLSQNELRNMEELKRNWERLDAVVIGIGGRCTSNKLYLDELPPNSDIACRTQEIIGDILGSFFIEDGSVLPYPAGYHLNAMSIELLWKVPNVIGIASGDYKVEAIYQAAKWGIIKTLITDMSTAKQLLQYSQN